MRPSKLLVALAVVSVLALGAVRVVALERGSESSSQPAIDHPISEASTIVEETRDVEGAPKDVIAAPAKDEPLPPGLPPQASSRLVIPKLSIDAPTVTLGLDAKGTMEAPSGPLEVGWYNFSSKANGGGNIVMSGHVDYHNYGPAVFARLRELQTGDVVQLLLSDESVATYRVTTISHYTSANAPVKEIVGKTPQETVTLITCEGTFDGRSGTYDKRLVVRAVRTI